jgi:hypothetical protein
MSPNSSLAQIPESAFNKDPWPAAKEGPVRFCNVGSQRAYHYLGSARIYYRMGGAFATGMIELLGK